MRRVRIHQAWYRAEVLGISAYGTLAVSGQPCASVLPDEAAERHLNFAGQDAIDRYLDRRLQGWGVDPIRCTKYLTSSQTLSFNMLAQAVARPEACAQLFNQLLNRTDLALLESSTFEFAAQGTPYSLGDKTLIDVLLRFRTRDGHLQVVALETKLADRFSTRRTSATSGAKYMSVAKTSDLWRDLGRAIAGNRTRQLARCHALAQSVQLIDGANPRGLAVLVVLTHPMDLAGDGCVSEYKSHVRAGAVAHLAWDIFLTAARSTNAMDSEMADELCRRYVDLAWSESAWVELDQPRVRSRARSA
jgi:hypothetical protein